MGSLLPKNIIDQISSGCSSVAQVSYLYLVTCDLGDVMARSLPKCFLIRGPLNINDPTSQG